MSDPPSPATIMLSVESGIFESVSDSDPKIFIFQHIEGILY